jgi:hypothetical protein
MTSRALHIVTYQGNFLYFPVEVRKYGSKLAQDLGAASAITIEWENDAGVAQSLINVLSTLPGADWPHGIVVLPITPSNFTAAIGFYTFSLTIQIGGQTITYDDGTVEVRERPGYPSAP